MQMTRIQRTLSQHRFRTEWPYPVAKAFHRYSMLPDNSRQEALRQLRLVGDSLVRYAALVALADRCANPAENTALTGWLAKGTGAPDAWLQALCLAVQELQSVPEALFVREFLDMDVAAVSALATEVLGVDTGTDETKSDPADPVTIEERLFELADQLFFLRDYVLGAAEIAFSNEPGAEADDLPATAARVCRGYSRVFPQIGLNNNGIPSGVTFIWNTDCTEILVLEPFLVYSLGTPLATAGKAHTIEGLMMLQHVGPKRVLYSAAGEELQFDAEALMAPELIVRVRDPRRGGGTPCRLPTNLDRDQIDELGRFPDDLPDGYVLTARNHDYEIIGAPIGRGGMGVVYAGRQRDNQEPVAIKALPLSLAMTGTLALRADREARFLEILSARDNPHIVRVTDHGQQGQTTFMVMEYVPGITLAEDLARRAREGRHYRFGEAMLIMEQLCRGLASVHAEGFIHRDLKPANILFCAGSWDSAVDRAPQVKIADFGLARRINAQSVSLTMTRGGVGTFKYMAPEQLNGNMKVDQRADVFALGKILTHMLTGEVPLTAADLDRLDFPTLAADAGDDRETASAEGILNVLHCCLAARPAERIQSVDELLHLLRKVPLIDHAGREVANQGVKLPEIRAAFGLARVGHAASVERLLNWALADDQPEHQAQAAVALAVLGDDAVDLLVQRCEAAADEAEQAPAATALSHVLRWQEFQQPRLRGQSWLRRLSASARKCVRRTSVAAEWRLLRRRGLEMATWHIGITAFLGAFCALPVSLLGANVFYRAQPDHHPVAVRVMMLFCGGLITGLWGAGFPLAARLARLFERPRRYLAMTGICALSLMLATAAIAGFCLSQGRGQLAVAAGGNHEAAVLLAWYFVAVSFFGSTSYSLYFMGKELPFVSRRLPDWRYSVLVGPIVGILLCSLTVPLFIHTVFTLKELLGELIIIQGTLLGVMLADYLWDKRYRRQEATTDICQPPSVDDS